MALRPVRGKICWRQEAGHNLIYSRFGAQASEKRQEGDSGSGLKYPAVSFLPLFNVLIVC